MSLGSLRSLDLAAIGLSVALAAAAQLALKAGMSDVSLGASWQGLRSLLPILLKPTLLAGLALYAGSMAVWLMVLSRVPVSVAYAFTGAGVVAVAILGGLLLGEPMTARRLAGAVLVACGLMCVVRG